MLVTHYYRPEVGAPQRRWDELVARFVAAGHEVAVLAPSPHYPSGRMASEVPSEQPGAVARGRHGEIIHRLRFHQYDEGLGGRGRDQLTAALDALVIGLVRFRGSRQPDVVVATVPGLPTLPVGLALGRVFRAPVVLEMRDAWPDLLATRSQWDTNGAPDSRLNQALRGALATAVTAMQRRATAVVTTTESFARVLRGRGMRYVQTIRHATSMRPVPTDRERQDSPLRVLYAGTVGRSQGLASAVRAAAECETRGVPIELRIVGEGAELPALKHLAQTLDAPVSFLPLVPAAELPRLYAWADTILVPLRAWDPLRWTVPSKLYDALATGRHVTAAVGGEAAEIVRSAAAGDVVPPDDAAALAELWATLAGDRGRLAVGDQGRAWIREHADDDAIATRYLRVIEEATAHG